MPDPHIHAYKDVIMIPVIADPPGARDKKYDYAGIGTDLPHLGTVKPMGILARQCSCEAQEAFWYGDRRIAQEKVAAMQKDATDSEASTGRSAQTNLPSELARKGKQP